MIFFWSTSCLIVVALNIIISHCYQWMPLYLPTHWFLSTISIWDNKSVHPNFFSSSLSFLASYLCNEFSYLSCAFLCCRHSCCLEPIHWTSLATIMLGRTAQNIGIIAHRLSKNVTFYINELAPPFSGRQTQASETHKPLILMLPWYGSRPQAVAKYCEIYFRTGFDVLVVESEVRKINKLTSSLTQLQSWEGIWSVFCVLIAENLYAD